MHISHYYATITHPRGRGYFLIEDADLGQNVGIFVDDEYTSSKPHINDILFFNTLYDENASCHLALGAAYTSTNLKDGDKYTEAELDEVGCNQSNTHVDFMFGSSDMEVTGLTHDGKTVQIFENGVWAI